MTSSSTLSQGSNSSNPNSVLYPNGLSYRREDWQQGYRSLNSEYDYWIDEVEGAIPKGLNGTLFRNGPGLTEDRKSVV